MAYVVEQIAQALRAAREGKGLSQRALAKMAGVPQSHISKIESGAVDLRLSSLVEIARALDLDVTLVPRKNLSAVQSIVRGSERRPPKGTSSVSELNKLQHSLDMALHEHPAVKELAQIQRQVRDLRRLAVPPSALGALREIAKALRTFRDDTENLDELRRALSALQHVRNTLVHETPREQAVKPAYSLEDDDHG